MNPTPVQPNCVVALINEPSSLLVARAIIKDRNIPLHEMASRDAVILPNGSIPLVIFQGTGLTSSSWFSPTSRDHKVPKLPSWATSAFWGVVVNASHIHAASLPTEKECFERRVANCAQQVGTWFFTRRFQSVELTVVPPMYPWGKAPAKKPKTPREPFSLRHPHFY